MMALALISLAIWIYLLVGRGGFWLSRDTDEPVIDRAPGEWPSIGAIIPARDEHDVIAHAIRSLLLQDYPGMFKVFLVDDSSSDGTADVARRVAAELGAENRLVILQGRPLPPDWTGKLWALSQGTEVAQEANPSYYWFSDADIVYHPDTLRTMVMRAEKGGLASVSLMAHLRCRSLAERMLIPAFIFFFQMLYPFSWVNNGARATAAAAGGCILVRRTSLDDIGGVGAIRRALIDDCALAAQLKQRGGKIWLGLSHRVESIRVYDRFNDIRRMVARSAYAQLRYSPLPLLGTLAGMAVVYVAPPAIALLGGPFARYAALITWACMAFSFMPTLKFYRVTWLWAPALPLIAACYMGFTLDSAWQHLAGRGGMWKGRIQAPREV